MEFLILIFGICMGISISILIMVFRDKERDELIAKLKRAKRVAESETLRERKINDIIMEVKNGK